MITQYPTFVYDKTTSTLITYTSSVIIIYYVTHIYIKVNTKHIP